jgi:hypothetical protein
MGPKVVGVRTLGILGLTFESPGTKCHLHVGLVERHIIYYKGGRWWLPSSPSHGESYESKFDHGSS